MSDSTKRQFGGTSVVEYIKDKQPVFDEELGTYICGEQIAPGHVCKGTPIAPRWRCYRHGGKWKVTEKALESRGEHSIYSTKGLWRGYHNIRKELLEHPEYIEQLYSSNISEELAIARIVLAELMQRDNNKPDATLTPEDKDLVMKALRLVAKIAKTAKEIQVAESHVIKREFMDGIIAAVTHAFTRANAYTRPSDRARIFMQEFSSMLPNTSISVSTEDIVEGEAEPIAN